MEQEVSDRLEELRAEFEIGQRKLEELESQAAAVRSTLLRISGAVQVLEELLNNSSAPVPREAVPHNARIASS